MDSERHSLVLRHRKLHTLSRVSEGGWQDRGVSFADAVVGNTTRKLGWPWVVEFLWEDADASESALRSCGNSVALAVALCSMVKPEGKDSLRYLGVGHSSAVASSRGGLPLWWR